MDTRWSKVRHATLLVTAAVLTLVLANLATWAVPRRFGLPDSPVGSSYTWFGGLVLDLPGGLAAAFVLVMVLIGFAAHRHERHPHAMAIWAVAGAGVAAVQMLAGIIAHDMRLGAVVLAGPDIVRVSGSTTLVFTASAMVGVLGARIIAAIAPRRRHAVA